MLWHDKRFRWGLFTTIIAGIAWFALVKAITEPEQIHADLMLVRVVSALVALATTALGGWLIVPVVQRERKLEAERPAPTREDAVQRAFKWGAGMLIVALLPLFMLVLFHFMGSGIIPDAAKIGPAVWATLLIVSGVLLMRANPLGALLGAILAALGGVGLLVSVFVGAGGGGPTAVIMFLLAFVAAPRLWKIRKDLKRTSA